MIDRIIEYKVRKSLEKGKVVGVFGPRRSGKTTLLNKIKTSIDTSLLYTYGENMDAQEILSSQRLSIIKQFLGNRKLLFVDEAQKIPNIGTNLKLIVDNLPDVSIFVTGSSSFDLRNKIGEPLVGRSEYFYLYPFSVQEIKSEDFVENKTKLDEILIYGLYPQVYQKNTLNDKRKQLDLIRDGYMLKDILELDNIKNSVFILNLLRMIAFQIGNDISFSELAANLSANKKTVMRYLDLLEKSYVIFSHYGFSRNLRKEYSKSPRYYFWDNGIRNSVISNFNRLELRDDVGKLWENFCVSERVKYLNNNQISANRYFWRTYDQKEIDLIEEREGKLFAFEFKYKEGKEKVPKDFVNTYKNSKFKLVNKENYLEFFN